MAQIIGLPKLSPTMEEGVLVKWVKKEGDAVEPGDLVAEVETDKANMDFNLEDEGVLLKLLVAEGDTVKLGAPVAILGEEGEDIAALVEEARSQVAAGNGAPAAAPPPPPQPPPSPPRGESRGGGTAATERPPATTAPPTGARLLASPLAKTLAIELGIDLRTLQGSGPGGRIIERDVRAAAEGAPARPAARPVAAPAGGPSTAAPQHATSSTALAVLDRPPATAIVPPQPSDEYVDRPLTGIRKTIARRLGEVKVGVPHFYLRRDFDCGPMMQFRKRLNALMGDAGKVSPNDLIVKGAALALRRVPACNAAFVGDAIRYYTVVHIGVAVAIEEGLVTPVVRNADLKGIGVIGREIKDLATRARERDLKAHEIQGSTFTVSNLGMFGIDEFEAIINPPEAAILAVGTIREEPVAVAGEIMIGQRMTLSLSCDHRVIDGALGARFLSELADLLESPESLAL